MQQRKDGNCDVVSLRHTDPVFGDEIQLERTEDGTQTLADYEEMRLLSSFICINSINLSYIDQPLISYLTENPARLTVAMETIHWANRTSTAINSGSQWQLMMAK